MAQRLYGVRIEARTDVEVYHPDVRYFDIVDARRHAARRLLPRPVRAPEEARRRLDGRVRRPHPTWPARTRCRSPTSSATSRRRSASRPSLLTHYDVLTLFHEFGHGLHHMLTRVDYPERRRHQRRAVGRGRAAEPVHGELRLARGGAAADLGPRRDRRAAAADDAAQAAGARARSRPACRSVRQLEFALFDFRLHAEYAPAHGARIAADARRGARRGGRRASAGVQPLPAQLPAHLLGRLRRRLLQLQVGRGAVGRRVRRVRGIAASSTRDGPALPRLDPRARRQPRRDGSVRRVPRPPAANSSRCCGSWASRPDAAEGRHLERQLAAGAPAAPDGLARGQPGRRHRAAGDEAARRRFPARRPRRRSAGTSRSAASAPTTASRSSSREPPPTSSRASRASTTSSGACSRPRSGACASSTSTCRTARRSARTSSPTSCAGSRRCASYVAAELDAPSAPRRARRLQHRAGGPRRARPEGLGRLGAREPAGARGAAGAARAPGSRTASGCSSSPRSRIRGGTTG